jgi:hypothetical protein
MLHVPRYDAEDGMDAEEEGLTWSAFRQRRAQEISDSFAGQDLARYFLS